MKAKASRQGGQAAHGSGGRETSTAICSCTRATCQISFRYEAYEVRGPGTGPSEAYLEEDVRHVRTLSCKVRDSEKDWPCVKTHLPRGDSPIFGRCSLRIRAVGMVCKLEDCSKELSCLRTENDLVACRIDRRNL